MNKEEVYETIVNFNYEHGEEFLDQGFHVYPLTYMTWCYAKGYLTREKYNLWVEDHVKGKMDAKDVNYLVYCPWDHVDKIPYSVVESEEWNEEDQEKAYRILAEFISEIDIYIDRLREFIGEWE